MKKNLLILAAAALFSTGAAFSQVIVHVRPPAPIYEHRPPAPGPRYAWHDGYHRWDGHRYVWMPGAWVAPPRPGVVWVPGHWRERGGGWVWIEGHWR
ncbi:YXWGXW repeat-containing protein [Silvibacterium acidisoli]|uniref:YXWGXW repeat-containing protein n=1 Tax=Acidobacteriaceae bacterium ZG23-2 TaxID=2883246 RepID=UPI00406D1EEA